MNDSEKVRPKSCEFQSRSHLLLINTSELLTVMFLLVIFTLTIARFVQSAD